MDFNIVILLSLFFNNTLYSLVYSYVYVEYGSLLIKYYQLINQCL